MKNELFISIALGAMLIPCASILAIGVFQKLRHGWRGFREAIYGYRLVPTAAVPVLAYLVVALEVGEAAAGLIPIWPLYAGPGLILLGSLFCLAQGSAMARGMRIYCGCHGADSAIVGWRTLIQPVCLVCCGAAACWLCRAAHIGSISYFGYWASGFCLVWLSCVVRLTSTPFRWLFAAELS